MNKKLYLNLVFLITGTFVVLTMGTIIGINFAKDSRLLAKPVMAIEQANGNPTPNPTPVKAKKNENADNDTTDGTYVYKRDPIPVSTPKPSATPTPAPNLPDLEPGLSNTPKPQTPVPEATPGDAVKPEATETPSTSPVPESTPAANIITEKVRVEVINCSERKDLAEVVRKKLEDQGFAVSAGNVDTRSVVLTEIIFRNDNAEAQKVRSIIPASKVSKQPDANSKYDVTIIIGDDYKP